MSIISDGVFSNNVLTYTGLGDVSADEANMVGRFSMENRTSSQFINDVDLNTQAVIVGDSPLRVAGVFGDAFEFNGQNYLKIPESDYTSLLNFTDAVPPRTAGADGWAVSFWVKLGKEMAGDMWLVSNPKGGSTSQFQSFKIGIDSTDGKITALASRANGATTTTNGRIDLRSDSDWHHYVIQVVEGQGLRLYEDNELEGAQPHADTRDGDDKEIWVGAYYDQSSGYEGGFTGSLDDLRFFNVGLTAAQIENIYNIGSEGVSSTGDITIPDRDGWRLEQDSTETLPDMIGEDSQNSLIFSPATSSGGLATIALTEETDRLEYYFLTLTVSGVHGGLKSSVMLKINGEDQFQTAKNLEVGTNVIGFTATEESESIQLLSLSTDLGYTITGMSLEVGVPPPSWRLHFDDPSGDHFQTAYRTTSIPRIEMPIKIDTTARIIRETFIQDPDYFTPTAIGTVHSEWDGSSDSRPLCYLIEEGNMSILEHGLQQWDKVWATKPATRFEYVTYSFTYFGLKYNSADLQFIRKPFGKNVVARIEYKYFHTSDPSTDITLFKKYQPKHSGNEVDFLAGNTTPLHTAYTAKIYAGSYIMAEDSQLARWNGNIWERKNITVLAL